MSRLSERFHWNAHEDKAYIETVQDVEPWLDRNKQDQADASSWRRYDRDGFHLQARIPPIVVVQWLNMGVNVFKKEDQKKVQQLLNSRDWSYLKTTPGDIKIVTR